MSSSFVPSVDGSGVRSEIKRKRGKCFTRQDFYALYDRKEMIQKAEELLDTGRLHLLAGNFQVAEKLFSDAIRNNPKDALSWTYRAQCHMKMEKFALSLEGSLKSLELDPKVSEQTYLRILQLYIIFGDLFNANLTIVDFKEVFPTKISFMQKEMIKLRDLESLEVRIDAAVLTSDFPSARDRLEKALQLAPQCLRYKKIEEMCHIEIERISKQAFEIDENDSELEGEGIFDGQVDKNIGIKGSNALSDFGDLDSEETVDEIETGVDFIEDFDNFLDSEPNKTVILDVSYCKTSELKTGDAKTDDLAEQLMQKFPQLTVKRVDLKLYTEDETANKKFKHEKKEVPFKEVTKVCLKRTAVYGYNEEAASSKKFKSSLIPVPKDVTGQKLQNPSRESPKKKLKRETHEKPAKKVPKLSLKRTADSAYNEEIAPSKKFKSSLIPVAKIAPGFKLKNPYHVPGRCNDVPIDLKKFNISHIPVSGYNFQSKNCSNQRSLK